MQELTPMMQQYLQIKQQNPDCLLFFRLGDFYEMFGEDAKTASRELDLTLTSRDHAKDKADEDKIPMCGVPFHSSEGYVARLVAKGYKVAICEQMEDPALAKGLVKRDIIRIVTPGTVTESSMLDEGKNNYFACAYAQGGAWGLGFCDVSTGACFATVMDGSGALESVINEMGRFAPTEALLGGEAKDAPALLSALTDRFGACIDRGEDALFALDACRALVTAQFGKSPEELGLAGNDAALSAVGALLRALRDLEKNDLTHIHGLEFYTSGRFMALDLTARRNLELTETMRAKEKRGSLLWVLDQTKTAMGARMLRSWLEKPLLQPAAIGRRLGAVDELVRKTMEREELILMLRDVSDLERVIARISTGTANCRDLVALSAGCARLPEIKAALGRLDAPLLRALEAALDPLDDLKSHIDRAIVDEPPFTVREGGMIRPGYHAEVDRLHDVMSGGKGMLASVEASEREKTGIKSLKVGYTRVFGYYIEVSKAFKGQVPETYIRKQTLVNGERYITQELKELENTILTAKDRIVALEYDLFTELRLSLAAASQRALATAQAVAVADVLASFAFVAVRQNYCRPEVDLSGELNIVDGRHPVVERVLKDALFVPNDTTLGTPGHQVSIITGPNMAGKSTYMRQVALIALMAQIGSFVPAREARIGVVDRIFTRIGASDDLSSGQSTFMVEMAEVAEILKNATKDSLLILDEIGRGTSTFDGMAIAKAVLEYIADPRRLGAKTLFATHYHELTVMEQELERVKNFNVSVKKRREGIIFLRKIVPGGADQSFGVEVAKLAGLPDRVITRARQILEELESGSVPASAAAPAQTIDDQVSLASMNDALLHQKLESITIETLTPIEAMNILYELKKML
ncbi:MAG: DNA mismatch repair protein MutS [Oscillospiraceae bacterium]|nr:DNA mismatch repair protein MutS [Oscillospiraceae bacterium]